jgi:small multidrug resistance family-3 protein
MTLMLIRCLTPALALLWGIIVDGFRPHRWDLLGAAIGIAGVVVTVAPSRG